MKRNWAIGALTLVIIWFGASIVRLENERFTLELEICGRFDPANPPSLVARDKCLVKAQTRTHAIYNLLYGLKLI